MRTVFAVALCCLVLSHPTGATAQSASPDLTMSAKVPLSLLMSLTEEAFTGAARSLTLAAASRDVQSGEWRRMSGLLALVQGKLPASVVWFANPDGSYYTVDKGPTGLSLADRSYFPKLLRGETVVGELVVSKSTGRNSAIVAVPVVKGGKTVGFLGASLYLDSLSERLNAALKLPADVIYFALDAPGVVTTLNAKADRVFLNPSAVGSESLAEAVKLMLKQPEGQTSFVFAGAERTVVFATSPLLKWHFVLGVVGKRVP